MRHLGMRMKCPAWVCACAIVRKWYRREAEICLIIKLMQQCLWRHHGIHIAKFGDWGVGRCYHISDCWRCWTCRYSSTDGDRIRKRMRLQKVSERVQYPNISLLPSAVRTLTILHCSSIFEFCNLNEMMSLHALPHQLDGALKFLLFFCALYRRSRMRTTTSDTLFASIEKSHNVILKRYFQVSTGLVFTTFWFFSFEDFK